MRPAVLCGRITNDARAARRPELALVRGPALARLGAPAERRSTYPESTGPTPAAPDPAPCFFGGTDGRERLELVK